MEFFVENLIQRPERLFASPVERRQPGAGGR